MNRCESGELKDWTSIPLNLDVLFIHQNFPGQFRHLAAHLARQPGIRVHAIGRDHAPGLTGVSLHRYRPHRRASAETHPYARTFEEGVLHGQQVLRLLLRLQREGYRPDIVIAHPGWGESLFVGQVFPGVPLVHFCEYYYGRADADAGFDPEFPLTMHGAATIHSRNAMHLLNLENCTLGITPTQWQYSLHPAAYRPKLRVIHEGIDTDHLAHDPEARLTLPDGRELKPGDPVVTYVARNLEPYRGFHRFMRALPGLLAAHPACQVLVIGSDGVSYGSKPKDALNWRVKLLQENSVDPNRVHFLGKVDYKTYRKALQVSAAHIYLTYPFVLSWSLLEALACGCLVVASDTAVVREVIRHEDNGILVDFFDGDALVARVLHAMNNQQCYRELRRRARHSALMYSTVIGNRGYVGEIKKLLNLPNVIEENCSVVSNV